jgi:hypothetical protein
MSNKWYIGQPIVAIKNAKYGNIKKGQDFIIKGLMSHQCKCKGVLIDVGIPDISPPIGTYMRCGECGTSEIKNDYIMWKVEKLFAPLDQDISELTDILKEPIKEFIEK